MAASHGCGRYCRATTELLASTITLILRLGKEEHREHKLSQHITRTGKGTYISARLSPLPARLLGQSYGHPHGVVICWRMLTASGRNNSLTILHFAEKLETFDWETLQVTCPTFHATLDTEKTTSDNDWEARKEIEVMCAMKYRKKTKCW